MPFTLECARPEDAAVAARLIAETDRDLFSHYAGGNLAAWIEISEHEWRHERGIYSYTLADVVRVAGSIRALLISYSAQRHQYIDWSLGCSAPHMPADLMARINQVRREVFFFFPMIPNNAWYVQNIAVVPEARCTGLGRFLMNAAEERAAKAGCASIHLDVDSSTPAVQFYRGLGFDVLVETRVPGIPAVHAHYRMAKRITQCV